MRRGVSGEQGSCRRWWLAATVGMHSPEGAPSSCGEAEVSQGEPQKPELVTDVSASPDTQVPGKNG